MKNSILLIDGHSILNRAFYGLPLLTNSKGLYTNAVYGFLNILFKVCDDICPDHIAVAFDLAAPTFRHEMYKEYKGTRKKMPEELHEQVPVMKQVLEAMGVTILQKEGFEADDLIGTESVNAVKEGMKVTILSGDRDLLQLVNGDVTLMLPKTSKGTTTIESFTPERVEEVYKIGPDKIVDLKAMMGDSSDNIPGLPGVGEKTATNLILTYGSLEEAHAHFEEIKPKKAMEAFRDHYDSGLLSKRLATIKTDVDMDVPFESLILNDFYTQEAYSIFKDLEFKNFLTRFDDANKTKIEASAVRIEEELAGAEDIIAKAAGQEFAGFYLDIENEDGKSGIKGLALAFDGECVYIKAQGFISGAYLKEALLKITGGCAQTATIGFKEQQNIIQDERRSSVFDCAIAAYLLDPLRSDYAYDHIAAEYADAKLPSAEEIVNSKITKKTVITDEQRAQIAGYTAQAAYVSEAGLKKRLEECGMSKLFYDIEMPFAYTLSDMERAGIKMNAEELLSYSDMLKEQIDELEKRIYEQAGEEFNIQSPKQLGVILFEKLKLKGGKKTKTGYSTAVEVLEKIADDAPIVNDILKYRQYTKLKSTYADSLGDYVREDGRIHSHFQQTVTATGRISSTDPNMQNIPVRMEIGRRIRKVFVPEDGYVFVDADYSQIELRVLAHMSGDEKLIEAYKQDSDIHKITASQVFGVPLDEVTPLQRRNAKAVNFGIVYGISSFGLSQDLSISRKEAQVYIEKYFETYPDIKKYLDKTVENAKKNGYTTTMFGRRRPIPELKESNFMRRQFGERVAMNSPIQGTAADIIKIAMNNVSKRLRAEGLKSRLILQVHDELLIEAKLSEKDEVCRILKEEMENAAHLKVELIVDMNSGYNWDEAH
jgi:DNA polymerase-1